MTSTLPPEPPNFPGINYNPSFWSNANSTGLTYNQALKNFLAFPVAQGTETLQNTNVNGTLTIINTTTPSETYSQYVDPNPNLDMTLSTTQTTGGLTIRTPTNSFTMNPNTFNINLTTPTPVTGLQMLNPINMANFNIVNMGQYSTAYTQALNTNEDYIATCNYVNDMISQSGGILDNNNIWTGTNQFQNFVYIGTVNASNYYSQLSQLANGALNINNQTPSANFPNINFKCNNGSNTMTTYFSITPQELDTFTTLNMNNNQIINSGGVQIGGATANTYTQLIQGGSTFGINNLYPSSSSPQISLAVKNLSESLQGLIITSSGVNLNTQLNMSNYNIINLGSGTTATTQTYPNNTASIATCEYVTTAINNIVPTPTPYFYGTTATISWNQVTTGYFNGNYYPNTNGSYDQLQSGVASITFTVPKDPVLYPVIVTANLSGNIQFPTGGTSLNANTGPYQPFSGGSTPYSWNGTQFIWGYGCTVTPPSFSFGSTTVTVSAQTFFNCHLNSSSNININANPFTQVSFFVYQS